MYFLTMGWKINESMNVIQITCLVVFFVFLIFSIVCFIGLLIYKNILKNLIIALKEAEKISRSSIQSRLKRIDDILEKNPNNLKEKALKTWLVEYKLIIENKFLPQVVMLQEFFVIPKLTWPTIRNLKKTRRCLEELRLISQRIYLLFYETEKILAWEMIQRDTRIRVRELFNDLKLEADEKILNPSFKFDKKLLNENFISVNKALNAINRKIIEGNHQVAEIYQEKTNEKIFYLINLLDLFENAERLLNNVLPDKITKIEQRLKNKILDSSELKTNLEKLNNLKKRFDIYKKQVFDSLYVLDCETCFKKLTYISELVSNFENDILYEENIKIFINDNLQHLNKLFVDLEKDFEKIKHLCANKQNQTPNFLKDSQKVNEFYKRFATLLRQWQSFYNSLLNIDWHHGGLDFANIQILLTKLLKELQNIYQFLVKIGKDLKTGTGLKEEIEFKMLSIRATLSTSEVAIAKNSRVLEIDSQKKLIDDLYLKLEKIEKNSFYKENRLNSEAAAAIFGYLDKLMGEAFDIKNNIKNKFLLEALLEHVIIYLERYFENEDFLPTMEKILESYQNRNLTKSMNLALYSLQKYKLND